ncbi:hypothetical protein ILUMI_05974 [Ignelater luminosus]|uniref:Uncharacterized protein n=1 Tax=Ignelater luminosus TaxID=2038154 RepID=A0A8K0DBL8_IGNLU|nr:hypothetical protein ILUMI_05974 [Ignelater luminosus]
MEGYYWRDYDTNDIPNDAILGGTDGNGNTYVGQTADPYVGILPGEIDEIDKRMYYEFGYVIYSTTVDVKILCSQQPEKLQWIPTKANTKISSFKDKKLILGGHAFNSTQLIGRITLENGAVAVGRILVLEESLTAIFVRKQGKTVLDLEDNNIGLLTLALDVRRHYPPRIKRPPTHEEPKDASTYPS